MPCSRTSPGSGRPQVRLSIIGSLFATAACLILVGCGSRSDAHFVHELPWAEQGVWLKADLHMHSTFSDGSHPVEELARQAVQHGCDVIAVTDHSDRDLKGASSEYGEAIEVARREQPGLIILSGLEWNVPPYRGTLHAPVLMAPGAEEFGLLAEFKRQFDDLETAPRGGELAEQGLRWLEEQAPGDNSPVVFLAHPGRNAKLPSDSAVWLSHLQKSSRLVAGFEGAPGHQHDADVGAYREIIKPLDRWDPAVAEIGGAWDALLRARADIGGAAAPSDFHNTKNDYWPGEFSETWLYAPDRSAAGALAALRNGSYFGVHGAIAREVSLEVEAPGLSRAARAGEVISVPRETQVTLRVSCRVPASDWSETPNHLDEIEFIVVDVEHARSIKRAATERQAILISEPLLVPPGGLIVRARGRRIVADGPDLLFYTNPIRIEAPHSGLLGNMRWGGLGSADVIKAIEKISGGLLGLLAVISLVWTSGAPRSSRVLYIDNAAPHRWHYGMAALLFTLFAIYGSLVPLNYRPIPWDESLAKFRAVPMFNLGIERRSDWVANILLFIPISYCWLAVLTLDRRSAIWRLVASIAVLALSVSLSVGIEFTQLWFPPRTVSQNDIAAESLGALLGVLAWLLFGGRITAWLRSYTRDWDGESAVGWMLQAYIAGLVVYALLPLDITISPGELYRKYREGKLILVPFWVSDFGAQGIWSRFIDAVIYLPVGYYATWAALRRGVPLRSVGQSVLLCALFVAALEICQVFVYSRFTESTDVLTGTLGCFAGGWLAHHALTLAERIRAPFAGRKYAAVFSWWMATSVYAGLLMIVFWWPYVLDPNTGDVAARLQGFWRLPFAALYYGSEYNAVTQVLRKALYFAPLGAMVAQLFRIAANARWRRSLTIIGLSLCFPFGFGVELGQAFLLRHTCDITDALFHCLGVAGGAYVSLQLFRNASQVATRPSAPQSFHPELKHLLSGWRGPVAGALVGGLIVILLRPTPTSPIVRPVPAPLTSSELDNYPDSAQPSTTETVPESPSSAGETPESAIPHSASQPPAVRSFADRSGSVFTPLPRRLDAPPVVTQIPIPDFYGAHAIWGATGRDDRGHIWFGVSANGVPTPSAHLFEYIPDRNEVIDRGSVVTELRRAGVYRADEQQIKIHSKIVQADDGWLYFASMDEDGEKDDGSQLPNWGSHLWRIHPETYQWEHLHSAPEGLIAVSCVGRWVYSLGLFDHVLYQFDTETHATGAVRVGSVGGHISRNFLSDENGHAYVPRLRRRKNAGTRSEDAVDVTLVELDASLRVVGETPLENYRPASHWHDHGIVGFVSLADHSIVFSTSQGYLYRIEPSSSGAAAIAALGWIYENGPAYTPSLFTYSGERYVVGMVRPSGRTPQWVTYDLSARSSVAQPLPLPTDLLRPDRDLLLYGSVTRDPTGDFYLVGQFQTGTRKHPLLLKVSP